MPAGQQQMEAVWCASGTKEWSRIDEYLLGSLAMLCDPGVLRFFLPRPPARAELLSMLVAAACGTEL